MYLADDFNDNSLDTGKWLESTNAGSSVTEQNQRLEMISSAGASAYVRSANSYVPQNSQIIVHVLQHCTDAGLKFCPTDADNHQWDTYNQSNWYNFQLTSGGVLSPNVKDGGSAAQVGGDSPGLTAPYWMRIRVDSTTIYFDYATVSSRPKEADWTNISSETWDMGTGITQAQYVYMTGYNTPTTGVPYFDSFSWDSYPKKGPFPLFMR